MSLTYRDMTTQKSFNRTFMELKLGNEANRLSDAEVLIVPLWN